MWLCCQQNSAMWLLLISCHLHEHGEFEFSCARTSSCTVAYLLLFKEFSRESARVSNHPRSLPEFLCPHAHARIPASLLQIIPEPKQSADRNQLDAVVLT